MAAPQLPFGFQRGYQPLGPCRIRSHQPLWIFGNQLRLYSACAKHYGARAYRPAWASRVGSASDGRLRDARQRRSTAGTSPTESDYA